MTIARKNHLVLTLGLATLLLYCAVLNLPYIDRKEFKLEEGRRASIAINMLETGNFVVPVYEGRTYVKKPPLFNWLLAGAFRLSGGASEGAARSVSTLAAFLAAGSLALLWKRASGESGIWFILPGLIYLTLSDVLDKAMRAEIDMVFAMLVTLSLVSWFWFYALERRAILAWTAGLGMVGLAVLAKGVQAPVFFYSGVVPYLFLKKRLRDLVGWPHVAGLCVGGLVFSLWLVPLVREVGLERFVSIWWGDIAERGEPVRGGGFWGHLLQFPVLFVTGYLPWVLVLGLWFLRPIRAAIVEEGRSRDLATFWVVFLILAVPPYWLIPGALMRYLLPAAAGVAMLSALPLHIILSGRRDEPAVLRWFFRGIAGILVLAVFTSPFWGRKFEIMGRPDSVALMVVLLLLSTLLLTVRKVFRHRLAIFFALLLVTKVFWASFYLTHDGEQRSFYRVAASKINAMVSSDLLLCDWDLKNPNLTYYLERDVLDVVTEDLAALPSGRVVMAYRDALDAHDLQHLSYLDEVKVKHRTVVLYATKGPN